MENYLGKVVKGSRMVVRKQRTHNIPEQKELRRILRTNSTSAEATMWRLINKRQLLDTRWRRQFSIGQYILDFYCPELKIAIELDGSHHFTANGNERDFIRDRFLTEQEGIVFLRFENKAVWNNTPELVQTIIDTITDRRNKIYCCKSND